MNNKMNAVSDRSFIVSSAKDLLLDKSLDVRFVLMTEIATDATGDVWFPNELSCIEFLKEELISFDKVPSNDEDELMKQCQDVFIGKDCSDPDVLECCKVIVNITLSQRGADAYAKDMLDEAKRNVELGGCHLIINDKQEFYDFVGLVAHRFRSQYDYSSYILKKHYRGNNLISDYFRDENEEFSSFETNNQLFKHVLAED